ncbi:hypothetical protein [Xylanimonas protaetiae]|uniref:Uncharacterized protein n=1 Tax=Xylanimonas protaetiae TaxID=2509457 RepID=A0A4P6FAQ0_9MICO|nr:hypothetical protein [Xylanimonas protaetiae]QAY70487.1 hypothetical protein ET471_10970 [Xylanimonas protaetiae]
MWDRAEAEVGPLRSDTVPAWLAYLAELDAVTTRAHEVAGAAVARARKRPRLLGPVPPPREVAKLLALDVAGLAAMPAALWFTTEAQVGPLRAPTAGAWSAHLSALAAVQRATLDTLRALVGSAAATAPAVDAVAVHL